MWLGGLILKERIPLLASPRGGVAASPRKWCEASLWTPPGWCSLSHRSEHHPVLAKSECSAIFFLIARPPLLAVMRGGEFAILKIVPSLDSSAWEEGKSMRLGFVHNIDRPYRRSS